MAYAPDDRCPDCGARVEYFFVPSIAKALRFDPTNVNRQADPLAKWVTYAHPRTFATVARRIVPGEHLDFDGGEEVVRLHRATCASVVRNDHDR